MSTLSGEDQVVYVMIANNRGLSEECLTESLKSNSCSFFRDICLQINAQQQSQQKQRLPASSPPGQQKPVSTYTTVVQQGYAFTFELVDGIIYICCTTTNNELEERIQKRVSNGGVSGRRQKFLKDLKSQYLTLHLPVGSFHRIISQLMVKYNSGLYDETDKVGELKKHVDDVKGIMMQNFDKILERGEKIEDVLDQSERLLTESNRFRDNSALLRRTLWWKNVKIWIAIFAVFIVILMIVLFSTCGFDFSKCK